MSAPSKTYIIQLVTCLRAGTHRQEVQPDERLAITSELNPAPGGVIYHRVGGRYCSFSRKQYSYTHYWQGYANPTGSETVAQYQRNNIGTWETHNTPEKVCGIKPINGKITQMVLWGSDKLIVAVKSRNGDGAKGLTGRPMEGDTSSTLRTGVQLSTKPIPMTYFSDGKEVFLKSWMRENCTHDSACPVRYSFLSNRVRGFIMDSLKRGDGYEFHST